ncbi:MAG: hypothetical protein WKF87_16015 [Chryseolinea sp.]
MEPRLLNDILIKEILRLKEENDHLKFELVALNSINGHTTAYPKRFSRDDLIPNAAPREVLFHQNARFLRMEQRMSHKEIAAEFGVPADLWLMYENNLLPTQTILLAICKSFSISADDLLHSNLSEFVNDWSSEVFGRIHSQEPTLVIWNEVENTKPSPFTFRELAV